MATPVHIEIFQYRDYRVFLQDWYQAMKQAQRGFSFRAFSQRAGFTSPNFLKLVMDGQRNLTAKSLEKFIVGLKLNKQETAFFRDLVAYTQAKSTSERNTHYEKMLKHRKVGELRPLEQKLFAYYNAWHHPVVRELCTHPACKGSADWIAAHIRPQLDKNTIEESLELLEELGLISSCPKGLYQQTDTLVTSGTNVASATLLEYHRQLLQLTHDLIDTDPKQLRDISALTLGVRSADVPAVKKRIEEFRKELLAYVADVDSAEQVILLNMQLLSVSTEASS